jgi:hypothetical protein
MCCSPPSWPRRCPLWGVADLFRRADR